MAVSIVKRLDDAMDAMSPDPTKAEVRACFRQVLRFMMLMQLRGHVVADENGDPVASIGDAEVLQTLLGDLIEPSPDGVMREMLDRNYRFDLTGEHHGDGAPVEDDVPVRERQDLPPPPPPRPPGP